MKKFFGGACLVLLLSFLLPGMVCRAADTRTIANGVFIGTVDVSGMSQDEATAAVDARVQELRDSELLLMASADQSVTVTGADLGINWANKGVVKEAFGLGRKGNIVQRYKALKDLENFNQVYDLNLSYDNAALETILEECHTTFDKEKINFTLTKGPEGFVITDGQVGYLVDKQASAAVIKEVIKSEWTPDKAQIQLVVKEDAPLGSKEVLSQVKDVLGTFTTNYKTSGAARSANVANGCSLINGTMVYPGEEFSVLDKITPFTQANGYFPAGSYLNGLVVESVGGGICQVSTTLYNAVLLAELEVTERHNHSMIVTYVSPSADAAIAESGGKNFKFINNTEYPIYIDGYTTPDKNITFTIYGVETRPSTHQVSYESEVIETTPASADQYTFDGSEGIGYVGTQSAHIGYKARLWKIVKENGVETERTAVNSSNYKMVPRIVTVGTAGADENDMAQLQAAIATGDVGTVKAVAGALLAAKTGQAPEAAAPAPAPEAAPAPAQESEPAPVDPPAEDMESINH